MAIRGTQNAGMYRAAVLIELYGLTPEQAWALKQGDVIDAEPDIADKLIEEQIAEEAE